MLRPFPSQWYISINLRLLWARKDNCWPRLSTFSDNNSIRNVILNDTYLSLLVHYLFNILRNNCKEAKKSSYMLATLKVVHTSCVLLLASVSNKGINTTMAGNQYRSLASDIIIRIIRLIAIRLHVIQLLRNKIYAISAQQKISRKENFGWY